MSNEAQPTRWRHLAYGLVFGVAAYLVALALTAAGHRDSGGWWALNLLGLMAVVTVILVIMAAVAVSRPSGRRLAFGLFASVAIGLAVDGIVRAVLLRQS